MLGHSGGLCTGVTGGALPRGEVGLTAGSQPSPSFYPGSQASLWCLRAVCRCEATSGLTSQASGRPRFGKKEDVGEGVAGLLEPPRAPLVTVFVSPGSKLRTLLPGQFGFTEFSCSKQLAPSSPSVFLTPHEDSSHVPSPTQPQVQSRVAEGIREMSRKLCAAEPEHSTGPKGWELGSGFRLGVGGAWASGSPHSEQAVIGCSVLMTCGMSVTILEVGELNLSLGIVCCGNRQIKTNLKFKVVDSSQSLFIFSHMAEILGKSIFSIIGFLICEIVKRIK